MSGVKYDQDKIPIALLPKAALLEVGKVLGFGATKYSPWNWSKGFEWSRAISAAQRHLWAFEMGEDTDSESKCFHIACAICNLLFLLTFQLYGIGKDDRAKIRKINR